MGRAADRSRWDLVPLWLFAGGMILSYVTLRAFAVAIGFDPWIAWIFPLLPDGLILYAAWEAAQAAAAGRTAARWWAWGMVICWTAVSAGLQAWDHVELGRAAMAGHMVPPLVMLCAWEMRLRREARHAQQPTSTRGGEPVEPGAVHAQLRAEVRDQLAATLRAEVAAELRGLVARELDAIRTELARATTTMVTPGLPDPLPAQAPAELPAMVADQQQTSTPAGTPPPATIPARDRDRGRAGRRDHQRARPAAGVQVRLAQAYQTNPDVDAWTERSLAEAASCGKTAARAFLKRQRATTTTRPPGLPAQPPAVVADQEQAGMPAGDSPPAPATAATPARDHTGDDNHDQREEETA